ncbi:MAG: GNAT family N-acetyltransferase, partial [Candidatus Bathyarchaeia archaeon]
GYQHKGFGKSLLEEAERISIEQGCRKILVTSALGTKRYYMRFGYVYDGPYMSKNLYG